MAATSFTVVSSTEITAVSPAQAAGRHNIYVTTPQRDQRGREWPTSSPIADSVAVVGDQVPTSRRRINIVGVDQVTAGLPLAGHIAA